jgi:hypothetical protein
MPSVAGRVSRYVELPGRRLVYALFSRTFSCWLVLSSYIWQQVPGLAYYVDVAHGDQPRVFAFVEPSRVWENTSEVTLQDERTDDLGVGRLAARTGAGPKNGRTPAELVK